MADPRARTPGQVVEISNRAADAAGIPRLLPLACFIAESNLLWNARRPFDPDDDATAWPDVSGGVGQQLVRFDPDYQGGAAYPGPAEVERVLALQYDVERSVRVAVANLAGKFRDGTETADDENLIRDLYEYNWPAGHERPWSPQHEANYRRGLAEARRILGGSMPTADVTPILNRVIELGRSQIGKRYAGPIVGEPESYRWGDPGFDCSSFVSWCYQQATGGAVKLTAFTDAAYGQCEWQQQPRPGDAVFYHYADPSQPGVKFPHMGIWLSTTQVLDCRYGVGVGVHDHVTPVGPLPDGRYRQTMRPKGLANVVVNQPPAAPPLSTDPRDAVIAQLRADLDDARSKLGAVAVDYAGQLRAIADRLAELKPPA